jgi:predicted O-methyltransferase YrrM
MEKYNFTKPWFFNRDLKNVINVDTNRELHILEIGSYEGKSTIWFIDTFLKNKFSTITCIDPWLDCIHNSQSRITYRNDKDRDAIFNRFSNNIDLTGKSESVIVERDFSYNTLKKLFLNNKQYDIVYIDGNHTASFVLEDSVLSFPLVKKGGLLIWDDYNWTSPVGTSKDLTPKIAIDGFLSCYSSYLKILHKEYKVVVEKLI